MTKQVTMDSILLNDSLFSGLLHKLCFAFKIRVGDQKCLTARWPTTERLNLGFFSL